jgi:hypothetical protein
MSGDESAGKARRGMKACRGEEDKLGPAVFGLRYDHQCTGMNTEY